MDLVSRNCKNMLRSPLFERLDERRCMAFGDIDQSFGTGGYVEVSHAQSADLWDSIGGFYEADDHFTQIIGVTAGSGHAIVVANIAQNGALTSDFGGDGQAIVVDPLRDTEQLSFDDVIQLADGSHIVRTSNSNAFTASLLSILPDGTLNKSFGDQGVLRLSRTFYLAKMYSHPIDGFLLGISGSGGNDTSELWKYRSDGSIDRTWGFEGQIIYPRMDTQPPVFDSLGGMMLFGQRYDFVSQTNSFVQLRYTPNALLDTNFGNGGTKNLGSIFADSFLINYDPATKGFVAFTQVGVGAPASTFAVKRLTESGDLDSTFGTAGVATFQMPSFQANLATLGLVPLADGGLLLPFIERPFGDQSRIVIAKLTPNGDLDLNFGSGGVAAELVNLALQAREVVISSQGEIFVYGEVFSDVFNPWILKFGSNGRVDRSFGTNGLLVRDYTADSSGVNELSLTGLKGDRWLVNSGWDIAASKLGTSKLISGIGSELNSFPYGGLKTELQRNAPASDGGWFSIAPNQTFGPPSFVSITKYTSNGQIDVAFGSNGRVTVSTAQLESIRVRVERNGSVLVFGGTRSDESKTVTDEWGTAVAFRLTNSGIDTQFGTNGVLRVTDKAFASGYATPNGLVMQFRDFFGNIILRGYNSSGILNPNFGFNGESQSNVPSSTFLAGAVDELGRVLAVVRNPAETKLLRFTQNGEIDVSFGIGGEMLLPISDGSDSPVQVAVKNAVIVVSGTQTRGQVSTLRLVAISNTGNLLSELDSDGIKDFALSPSTEEAVDLQFAHNGDLMLATTIRDGEVNRIGRVYRIDGTQKLIQHNWTVGVDVNNDDVVTPIDALLVINRLNGAPLPSGLFADTSNDGIISPIDALLVINHLNKNRGQGEGEQSVGDLSSKSVSYDDLENEVSNRGLRKRR